MDESGETRKDERCGHDRCQHFACDGLGCSECDGGFLPWCWAGCYADCTSGEPSDG